MTNRTLNSNCAPQLISLFSGCGGLDLGFEKAGFKRAWANDFDADAQAVYALNLGEIDGRDILSVGEDEIPEGDILTAGFPCQPFSNAGSRKGVHDSRGMLYKECLRIIKSKMPKVVVFENVKGLLSTKYIDGRNLVDVIIEDLSTMNNIGYNVVYKLLNAPYNAVKSLFSNIGNLITPFPVLCKDEITSIEAIISNDSLLSNRKYSISNQSVQSLCEQFELDNNMLLYGNNADSGYPIAEIVKGIAYIVADKQELNGKRPKGGYKELIDKHILLNVELSVEFRVPDLLTPIVIVGNGRGVLIGAHNPLVYKNLVSIAPDNEYKLCVRPITEEDLYGKK